MSAYQFPEDLTAPFPVLLASFKDLWPDGDFELHLAVITIVSKSGLCSQTEFDDFIRDLHSSGIGPSAVEYIRTVASLGRFFVHGPQEGQRTAVAWLREHYPNDELLQSAFCDE